MIVFSGAPERRVDPRALSRVIAVCHTCAKQHNIEFDPRTGPGNAFADWYVKHPGPDHLVEFRAPQRNQRADQLPVKDAGFLHYVHNADAKVAYGAEASYTITLASLAASSTYLAGRESGSIQNSSNYLDFLISGRFKAAATNTQVGNIQLGVVCALDQTPNWPDVFDGTESVETVTSAGIYNSIVGAPFVIVAESSASRVYETPKLSLCAMKGLPFPPVYHVLFLSHAIQTSTNAWDSTEGSHFLKYTPVYATVT